jgi:Mu-like prophage I protein
VPDLETVDLEGVEILAAGGPIRGIGSPPEGDFYTPADLRAMADAAAELGDELRPPAKIGHFPKSGDPAVGWLDNIRTNDDGSRLVADVRQVPRKFAEVLKAGAYRTRSVELGSFTSQRHKAADGSPKRFSMVPKGLAWLGAKLPAVQTLNDVLALYEAEDVAAPDDELETLVVYEREPRVIIVGENPAPADTRPDMPETKFTDEQRRAFSEATGLDEEKVTDEMLAKAGVKTETDDEPEKPEPPPTDEQTRSLEQRVDTLAQSLADETKRRLEAERARVIEGALRDGKFTPGEREGWERRYETSPDATADVISKLPKNDELAREYGSGEEPEATSEEAEIDKLYEADAAQRLGISKEALV